MNKSGVKDVRQKTSRTLAILLILVAVFVVSTQTVFAASKLTRKDFTKMSGRYKANFMSVSSGEDAYFHYANMIDETSSPRNVLETYRGITFGDPKSKVIKKYGNAKFKKIKYKSDNLYYALFDIDHDRSSYFLKKLAKYADYYYYKGYNEYRIRFYFDKKGTVQMIAYFKNYEDL